MTKRERKDFGVRPKCTQCDNDAQFMGTYRKDGTPLFRKLCSSCHFKSVAKKRGMKSILHVIAANAGKTANEYLNGLHPYKRYRKTYCENGKGEHAGWLGFVCTTRIVAPHLQLDTDHLDGNSSNNEEENMMTLCKCCHSIKTNMFMDYATPGRKSLKKMFGV